MEENKDLDLIQEENSVPEKPDYEAELIQIIKESDDPELLKERLDDYHENDIAAVLEQLSVKERRRLFKILGTERISEIFAYVDDMSMYLEEIGTEKAADILESMDADDAIDLLDELDEETRTQLTSLLNIDARHDIDLIASYNEDEIGSHMTTNFIVIQRHLSVKQAMRALVTQAAENDNLSTIYVMDDDQTFFGAIGLNDLIIAREYQDLEELIITSYPYVYAHEVVADCIEKLKDYSEDSIPVLDNNNRILGVITSQDVVEVVDEEMGEDYAKLGGLIAEEDLKEPLVQSIKKRMPWLIVLLLLGLVVSTVVGLFEHVVAELTMIVCFQSLILDMSGNVGTQSLAVTIRVLMDENLTTAQKFHLVAKEMQVGFCNGFLLGLISFVFIGIYICVFKKKTVFFALATSGCIGISLLVAMVISSMVGTVIPLFFHKIKVDPAVASGPLITTVNDLVAVVTYYGLTWILLINMLHFTGA